MSRTERGGPGPAVWALQWPAGAVFIAIGMASGCSSSAEGDGAAGGAGAGGGGGDGGAYLNPYAEQDAICDPYETELECLKSEDDTYCGWYYTTYQVPADSCELIGPVGRCVYDVGADTGLIADDLCPGEPESGRYWYRLAEPGWYDVVVVTGSHGMAFSRNGWNRCTVDLGIEQPPFCECLCAAD